LKNFQTSDLTDDTLSIPANDKARFKLEGILFQFPDFEQAEQIVEKLFAAGYLSFKQPLSGGMKPRRTYSRQTRHFTGISPYKLYQLQRMHQALRLLKHGATTADVVTELAFTDQAHFTHASKRLLGYTPKQLTKLLQSP
jgi:AraC-like DNA-binding protein